MDINLLIVSDKPLSKAGIELIVANVVNTKKDTEVDSLTLWVEDLSPCKKEIQLISTIMGVSLKYKDSVESVRAPDTVEYLTNDISHVLVFMKGIKPSTMHFNIALERDEYGVTHVMSNK